jgi:hypothetical protein
MSRFTRSGKPKEDFSWSYTKVRDYRTCPKKFYETSILKKYKEPKTPALEDGDRLHAAFTRRVEKNLPMPTAYEKLNDWGDEAAKIIQPGQVNMCDKEIALTRNLTPTGYFDNDVWLRIKIDLLRLFPHKNNQALAQVIDYKTGKPRDDIIQLAIYAQGVFSTFSNVIAVRTEFWWTQIKDKTHEIFSRDDMTELWNELLPELHQMEVAQQTNNYPAKKNGLCAAYCPVITCPHNGRR